MRKVSSQNLCLSPASIMSSEKLDSPASPAYSDAEKGILDSLPVQMSYFPRDKKDAGALIAKTKQAPTPVVKTTPKVKKRVSKWVLWKIWFNTYRCPLCSRHCLYHSISLRLCRKFFTFTFTLNMIGIGLATSGHFPYAVNNSGAMVLGNLNFAIVSEHMNVSVHP